MTYDKQRKYLYTEQTLQEVCLGINSMCVGAESRYFNGYTNITDDAFLVFGVKGLMDTNKRLKDAMLFNILSFMSNQLLGKGSTAASIDELYLFLTNMTAIEYIRNAMKRVRKKDSSIILASQNIEDFLIPSIREFTKPLFSIPTHQFLFNAGQINPKEYMDALQVEASEFELIKYPERGTCLYRCGNEFESVETMSSEILVSVAPEHQTKLIDESQYRELTSDDVDIMLAKHMLYMRDAGGEQANFSGCLIKDKGLAHAVFNGAIISNAAFVDCDLSEADLNFASAHGAKFINCNMEHIYGDEADFSYAQFTNCDMRHALTTHANYTGADFNQCNVERMLLQGCCLARVNWNGTDETVASRQGAVYTVEEYNGEQLPNEIKME